MINKNIFALSIRELIRRELDLFPLCQGQDILKLIYQAAYGPKHADQEPDKLMEWLKQEIAEVAADSSFPLLQKIHIHYPFFRLHLGPAMFRKISVEFIHELFLLSIQHPIPSCPLEWDELVSLALNEIKVNFSQNYSFLVNDMAKLALTGGPYHHSHQFKRMYQPHYRLLSQEAMINKPFKLHL